MVLVTSRDVEEIVIMLSSEKAKTREEGIKLLNTWLEGERSVSFCRYIGQKTAMLKHNDIPNSETWPFIITLLIQCISLEISSSKRRLPKLSFAKTLRIVVQRAEDDKFSGKNLLLLSIVKALYNHIWDIMKDIPSFQSEYGIILRHLLEVSDYRFHMRKRVYCNLVRLYMQKVKTSLSGESSNHFNPKEDTFRCIVNLHSLIENPPGDFPDDIRVDIVEGFISIFSFIRDEGKISRKLIECVNTYLLKDGPNLAQQSLEIHEAVQLFVFRSWLATHDRGLKDTLILYARVQLSLTRGSTDGSTLVEQLLDVIGRELDQNSVSISNPHRNETIKEDKFGNLTNSQFNLVELAALVFYRALISTSKMPSSEKRVKKDHFAAYLKDGLTKGKWLWNAAFCILVGNFSSRVKKELFVYWFQGLCTSLERIMNDANTSQAYEGLLWTFRSLHTLSSLLLDVPTMELSPTASPLSSELESSWHMVWSCVLHGLPTFTNVPAVADAAFMLLGIMIMKDPINRFVIPKDLWDLRFFKRLPSMSILCFISCYFSRRGSNGDLRDSLYIRENLLRSVMALLNFKDHLMLNEFIVVVLPAAVYALSTGCTPLLHNSGGAPHLHIFTDVLQHLDGWAKAEDDKHGDMPDIFDCSVEALANIGVRSDVKSQSYDDVRLPQQLRELLLCKMENQILEVFDDKDIEKMLLSDVFLLCAMISNFMFSSYMSRINEAIPPFLSKLGNHLLRLLDYATSMVENSLKDIRSCFGSRSIFDDTKSVVDAFKSFAGSPLLSKWKNQSPDLVLYTTISQSFERLLKALSKVYEECLKFTLFTGFEIDLPSSSASDSGKVNSNKGTVMDIELDLSDDSNNEIMIGSRTASSNCISMKKFKVDILTLMSTSFSVLPVVTWEILFNIMEKESDHMVSESILLDLCKHPYWPSSRKFMDLVFLMNRVVDMRISLKLQCSNVLDAMCGVLENLISFANDGSNISLRDIICEESLVSLANLFNRIAEEDVSDWPNRGKLVNCIYKFVLLRPHIGQGMIEKLFIMLKDPDYRVRLLLAKQIGTLFQTWEGHAELFQDICANFGAKLVTASNQKVITAKDVLAAGQQPRLMVETAVITLMHLALSSEKVELEAVYMICVVSALDPCHRELVFVVLDNLSRELQYTSRSKYLEELIGPIIFFWVECGVSLCSLIEIRDVFMPSLEPITFVQYCSQWLLPALVLQDDISSLNWISKIAHQPMSYLVKNHFVPIFSVCILLHCRKKFGWEKGDGVLQDSLLKIADISEKERDVLIRKHMVSIVSHIFSLASCASDPAVPFFSKDNVGHAIRTVVDGFLEMDDSPSNVSVVDKINVFRPDRVFMFIVEMHYKVTEAANYRHKCHRLAGIEVLVNILGHRAAVPSSFNYLLNLAGQFTGFQSLAYQSCQIISKLLEAFKSNSSTESAALLGEQLQFLVSGLVACCVDAKSVNGHPAIPSSEFMQLLYQLIVDADSSLHGYIRELEPFPESDALSVIREFHQDLCRDYSPKDHLLKLARRSCSLPPRLLVCSMKALHKKLVMGQIFHKVGDGGYSDKEIIHAVWALVRNCSLNDANSFLSLISDFISRVGIEDPHCVVFPPMVFDQIYVHRLLNQEGASKFALLNDTGISEELLVSVLRLLKKYLMDDAVKMIDLSSRAIQGILSTERGQRALLSFDSYERALFEVHSKGVNMELVQKSLLDHEKNYNDEATSLDNSTLWKTHGKSFETWICPLLYALIGYCDDVILRLCQDIVLLKSEVAELIFPRVLVNLAGRKGLNVDLCKIISLQVLENIFTESNKLTKSIQLFLDALNELRVSHVVEKTASSPVSFKREGQMVKQSSYGSKSRSASVKIKDSTGTLSAVTLLSSGWEKVYWLSVDYLVAARSAIICGACFSSVLYVEYWCEEYFNRLTLGSPDFSILDTLPEHVGVLVSAVTHINEPDSLYGIIQSHKLISQTITFEHEGNWSKALEYYDLKIRSDINMQMSTAINVSSELPQQTTHPCSPPLEDHMTHRKSHKGLIRSLQHMGCNHVLDFYCQSLTSRNSNFENDIEFHELQYEAAWRTGKWDFSFLYTGSDACLNQERTSVHFNENLHSCLRALQQGDFSEFHSKVWKSKQELVLSICRASKENTDHIHSTIIKLQIIYHLNMAWDMRWPASLCEKNKFHAKMGKLLFKPIIPNMDQLSWLNTDWGCILKRAQLHMSLLEPFISFRRVLLQILNCKECTIEHLLKSASTLRKGSRFSQAAEALHEFKYICAGMGEQYSNHYWHGRLEEAKLLRKQSQHEMAINLGKYILENCQSSEVISDACQLVGKWLAETRSSNSRTILEKYLKRAVTVTEDIEDPSSKTVARQSQTRFHLAHYADALFRSYEDRLNSSEWKAAMRLRKHKTKELEALIRRLRSSSKGDKTDYSVKILELQKQLAMDKEEAEKLQGDRDNFLIVALEGYERCLVIGDKYDVRVVFRLLSLWFSPSSSQIVIDAMLRTIEEVQSYKFLPLVYQIASRMGSRDGQASNSFQFALVALVKKMAIDHPYHTIFQLLALANGDRIKDKQRSRNSFVVDMDKKLAAENLLKELSSYHGATIRQMKQMVEIYIKLAELETKREDTNKKVTLPRDIRGVRQLELVPVVTSNFPVDRSCEYPEGSFPYFRGLSDTVMIMNGINAPKVVECFGSDGNKYRQLAKSGNDDLRQDAVMEQFFSLVNTFLLNHRDTWKRRLKIRTYKVVPFTPSAGVLEWVNGTLPLGEYLIGSTRNGGAHGRYGVDDWTFPKCREHMAKEHNKRKAFEEVCQNFRPVMHYFFLERFLHPADWFDKRLDYTRSVAASSMVSYIVGLGDRHSMNILIDQATAEVVHIDLGVAFEQGLMLKTPERVPFRLTRDIIDGMGVTGVEGVFRRCCEETLHVMRSNKEALLTIVQVFIHDPLYKWALSPLKALQRQKETDDDLETSLEDSEDEYEGNKDAARALMRVKQKLDGYEEGEMRSEHGQVQQLIQDAIDPDRLCQMFPGWGAWL
ncbi:serine/threonine-protein kinase ATM [Impatiens glandulifera]|uniref:serine/threonine-protein kinase ATM n=1 Tax=Impatiens glandulifera TaxID=253017 RepID=UPI001FB14AE4|nr:serine/threonine-protein kinase ATM [Impatiens glandulifera]